MATGNIVILTLVLLAQHQIIENHKIVRAGSSWRGSDTSFPWSKQKVSIPFDLEGDLQVSTTSINEWGQCLWREVLGYLPSKIPSPVPAAEVGRWVGEAIFQTHTNDRSPTIHHAKEDYWAFTTIRFSNDQTSDRPLGNKKVVSSGGRCIIVGNIFNVHLFKRP